jgi:hypothetical protein
MTQALPFLHCRSTIVNLIMRFYDPNKGAVLLDGIPLPDIDHVWLHSHISIVSQEPVLFAESLFYNITFGMPPGKATLAQVCTPLRVPEWVFGRASAGLWVCVWDLLATCVCMWVLCASMWGGGGRGVHG